MSGIKQSGLLRHLPSALALVTAVIATIWLGLSARTEYQREIRRGEVQTQLLATGLQDTTERHFNEINSEIVAIRQALEQRPSATPPSPLAVQEQILRVIGGDNDILRVIVRIDNVQALDLSTAGPEPAGDMPAIAWPDSSAAFPFGRVEIGAPVRLPAQPSSGAAFAVPMRYVFPADGGSPAVEIVALTDAEQILTSYESLDLTAGSAFAVLSADGLLLARWPRQPDYIGKAFHQSILVHHLKFAASATVRALVEVDDIERIVTYRSLSGWPLVVVAGVPLRGLLESFWTGLPAKLLLLLCLLSAIFLLWVAIRSSQSALRRSVQDLTVSEGRYARLLANIPGGVYTRRLLPPDDFDYPFASPGFLKLFGVSEKELSRGIAALLELVHPEDREDAIRSLLASVTGDEVWTKEFRIVRPDGQLVSVQSRARRYRDDEGSTLWDGITIDLTDLRQHEALLERVQKTAGLGYWTWQPEPGNESTDLAQRRSAYSPASADILGRTLADLDITDAEYMKRIVHPEDREWAAREYQRFLDTEVVVHDMEYRIMRPDGSVRWLHGTATKEIVEGKVVRIIGVMQDVTEAKAREGQLIQAQKMEAIGELTGGVAHDFNNLLTVIIGNLEAILERLSADAPLAQFAQAALGAADRGATLTKRLLAYARRQTLSPQPTDLHRLVSDLLPLLKQSVGELVDVEIDAEPNLPRALVDPHQLENAVINLANNARDAMPRGGRLSVHLDLAVAPANEDPSENAGGDSRGDFGAGSDPGAADGVGVPMLRIVVTDTGVGMTPDVLDRAVEPFFTTKPVGQGTGLGLSMVYGLVKQSKGQMRIRSEPGIGTTIRLFLPLAPAATADYTRVGGNLADFTGRRALLVDDDPPVRATTSAMLRSLGFQVSQAANGEEAMRILAGASPIDVLVTDVALAGGMLGAELAARARAARPGLKVLFISGFAAGVVAEVAPVLGKPFRRAELAAELAMILGE